MRNFTFLSPSSPVSKREINTVNSFCQSFESDAHFCQNSSANFYDLAGSDVERVEDLYEAFSSRTDAVFAIRGGYGSGRLLSHIDFTFFTPKMKCIPFFGYSDSTALQLALWTKCRMVTYSGFMPGIDCRGVLNPLTETYLKAILDQHPLPPVFKLNFHKDGNATGTLLGGCLSVLVSLIGTKFCPDFSNCILFLEDVGEPTYAIDRMLNQLKDCGILGGINGLAFGTFKNCEPRNENEFPLNFVLEHYSQFVKGPVCFDFPYGHIDTKVILPIGIPVTLDSKNGCLDFGVAHYETT